jgi:Protein of unknown function with PCYCGC motif
MFTRGLLLGFMLLTVAASSNWTIYAQPQAAAEQEDRVPAFNPGPAKGRQLPPILGRGQLWGNNDQYPFQSHAYELAAKIPNVIHQQPCYCYCDRGMGHKSLHTCFEGTHGAQCSTCMKEVYYAYQMTKQHKTAAQIRKGIIAGEWKTIDLQSTSIN